VAKRSGDCPARSGPQGGCRDVPGRETATVIHEVFVEAPGDAAAEWLEEFDAGFRAYEAGDFARRSSTSPTSRTSS